MSVSRQLHTRIRSRYCLTNVLEKEMLLLAIAVNYCSQNVESVPLKFSVSVTCHVFSQQPAPAFSSFNLDERGITKSHKFYSYLSTDPLDVEEEKLEPPHSCLFR